MLRKLTLLFVVALASFGACQDIPIQAPPSELSEVAWFIGEWSGKETYHFEQTPTQGDAKVSSKMALGGRYVHSMHEMNVGETKMEGMHMLTYDPDEKKWKGFWFDSTASGMMEMNGTVKDGVLEMISEPTAMPGTAEKMIMRATWTKKSDTEMTFLLEMKQGESWGKMIEGTYKKAA